ncbi:MAG TPA: DUF6152 family protein [Vicinamibacterales bacterium]|jgi:Family of unknown function (DUF6152)|nr:DUF6152 family protein [Vicinamibacterales bacterium]
MKRTIVMLVAGLALLVGSRQVSAHHSFSAEYDSTNKVQIEGVVTEFVWRNPHSFMKIDVMDKDGTTKSWTLEWGSVSQLQQYSITRTTLRAGDKIIVTGQAARDAAAPRVLIETVKRPADGWEWKGRVQ